MNKQPLSQYHENKVMNTQINFKLHASYIIETIKNQASGLPKALTELIMNSVDAGATKVEIDLKHMKKTDNFKFRVVDDGKGFTKKDIMTYFRYFGAPHEEGDAYYGCFRLGRGQLLAISKSVWRSNNYVFSVDIEKPLQAKNASELGFNLERSPTKVKGCIIEGETYPGRYELDEWDLKSVVNALKKLCAFMPIPVFVNKVQINTDVQSEAARPDVVHFEDENAHYLFDSSKDTLSLYNRGVKVEYARLSGFLMNGSIITKKQLSLSHSRNEVLGNCRVYKLISDSAKKCNELILEKTHRDISVNDEFMFKFLRAEVVSASIQRISPALLDEIVRYRFMTSNSLAQVSLLQVLAKDKISLRFENDEPLICEKIEREEKTYYLVHSGILYELYHSLTNTYDISYTKCSEWIFSTLKNILTHWRSTVEQSVSADDVAPVGLLAFSEYETDDEKYRIKYTPLDLDLHVQTFTEAEQQLLKCSELANNCIIESGYFTKGRKICLGQSDDPRILAWTNGDNYICVNRQYLSLVENNGLKLFNTLIHEYCHENAFDRYHYHDEDFYKAYHDATNASKIIMAQLNFQNRQVGL